MEDYQVWKDNFGNSLPAPVAVAVTAGSDDEDADDSTTSTDAAFAMYESPETRQPKSPSKKATTSTGASADEGASLLLPRHQAMKGKTKLDHAISSRGESPSQTISATLDSSLAVLFREWP